MAAELIGRARCWNPKCPAPTKARLSLSKSGLAVMTCNGCHSQLFSRSDLSDEALRDRHIKEEPAPEPSPSNEPAPALPPAPAPAEKSGFGWGFNR